MGISSAECLDSINVVWAHCGNSCNTHTVGFVMIKTHKITLKLVRSFSLGVTIYSPKLNGLCFEIHLACFHLIFWNRGRGLFGRANYWNG